MADIRPRRIAQTADLIVPISLLIPEERFSALASRFGLDLRQAHELCIGHFERTDLFAVSAPISPERVHRAFFSESTSETRRTVVNLDMGVVRLQATHQDRPHQLETLGREGLVYEDGEPGPLRAAEAFALGKLRRARHALASPSIDETWSLLDPEAELRAVVLGPLEAPPSSRLSGLFRTTRAAGVSVRWAGAGTNLRVRWVLAGDWSDRHAIASETVLAAVRRLADSSTGHLLGLASLAAAELVHPQTEQKNAVIVEGVLDALAVARGMRAATSAEIHEIMGF